jgi:hypothetical protein
MRRWVHKNGARNQARREECIPETSPARAFSLIKLGHPPETGNCQCVQVARESIEGSILISLLLMIVSGLVSLAQDEFTA